AAGSDVAPGLDELIADSHEGHRHFAQRLTVCRYCEFTCQQGAELADHVETEHVDDSTYWLAPLTQPDCLDAWLRFLDCRAGCGASAAACGICGDWIRLGASGDPEPLFLHLLRSHHPAELAGRAFRCVACPAASHTAAAAASHFWLCHCQRHRTRCPRCCRMVAQGGRHSCQHRLAGDRRLCLGCGREFASLSALRQHRLRPGDPAVAAACRAAASRPRRVRACEHCGRRFLHRANLLRHRRIHAASRLYRCPHCASAFSDVSNLAKHARCRHPGRPLLTCHLCRQFACDRVPEMRAHLAHCHSDSVCPADLRRVLRFLGLVADDAAGRSAANASADVPEGGRVAPVRERRSRMSAKLAAADNQLLLAAQPTASTKTTAAIEAAVERKRRTATAYSIVQMGCALTVVATEPAAAPAAASATAAAMPTASGDVDGGRHGEDDTNRSHNSFQQSSVGRGKLQHRRRRPLAAPVGTLSPKAAVISMKSPAPGREVRLQFRYYLGAHLASVGMRHQDTLLNRTLTERPLPQPPMLSPRPPTTAVIRDHAQLQPPAASPDSLDPLTQQGIVTLVLIVSLCTVLMLVFWKFVRHHKDLALERHLQLIERVRFQQALQARLRCCAVDFDLVGLDGVGGGSGGTANGDFSRRLLPPLRFSAATAFSSSLFDSPYRLPPPPSPPPPYDVSEASAFCIDGGGGARGRPAPPNEETTYFDLCVSFAVVH
uniref:C2H2-type domain-containing protein n=1 Tax=Macrostomum lignano TaxID=282301 RepID=A0A1I8GU21_9PLAT